MRSINLLHYAAEDILPLLQDRASEQALVFEMNTSDQLWCSAILLALDKEHAASEWIGLICLLKAFCCWNISNSLVNGFDDDMDLYQDMIQVFRSSNEIECSPVESFSRDFNWIFHGMGTEAVGAQFLRNGNRIEAREIGHFMGSQQILQAKSISKEWNDIKYFIETNENWLYFEWNTSA